MIAIPKMLLCAAIVAALPGTLVAQQAPVGYHSITCVKVNRGQDAQAVAWVNGNGRKLDNAMVDSGKVEQEIVMENVLPGGEEARCDYLFVTFYKGLPQEPLSSDEMQEMLHKAGIAMSVPELYAKYDELGKLVFTHILQYHSLVGGAKEGDYLVFNLMNAPDARACVAYEEKEWKPMAEQMKTDGALDGWAVNTQAFPRGDKDPYDVSTVDIFPSWDAAMNQEASIMSSWKKMHGDEDISTGMGKFGTLCPIEHTTMYKTVEVVAPKM
jgi:hypothetical protein